MGASVSQAFGKVLTRTWDDPAYKRLPGYARLLFLWSWTHPGAAVCGLYAVTPRELCLALDPGPDRGRGVNSRAWREWQEAWWTGGVLPALADLGEKPLLLYDEPSGVLWVVKRAAHALSGDRAAGLMRREWRECPASPLRDEFARVYGRALQLEQGMVR